MASKSLKDKSKVCESCDKKFGWNKKLLEHLEKILECKEFYISKEIPLPVTKVKGSVSKEENIEKQCDGISNNGDLEMKVEEGEHEGKVSVLKVYEDFNKKEQEAAENNKEFHPAVLGETDETTKRKNYSSDFKIAAISRIEKEGMENIKAIALDLRLNASIVKSWWEKRDKLLKIKSLLDKKAQLDKMKSGECSIVDKPGGETTLEESCEQEAGPGDGEKKRTRRKVCGECRGCLAEDCGSCKHCLDKPKFGGKNTIKQKCLKKICSTQQEERKLSKGKKGKVNRKNSLTSTADFDLSTSSELTAENTTAHSDISMEQNESSIGESLPDSLDTREKVVTDDLDELKNALGSIGADYSQCWSQEPSVTSQQKNKDRPLNPQMAAALELVPRTGQFPVLSNNHPSISEPEAIVTIERVDKKKKTLGAWDQSGQKEAHNINNILGQLRPVGPQWQWQGTAPGYNPPGYNAQGYNLPGYNPPGGDYQELHQTASDGAPSRSSVGVESPGFPHQASVRGDTKEEKETPLEESFNISRLQVRYLRSLSSKIIRNEMSEDEAAQVTGLSVEMIRCWVESYEDVVETNKAAVEKAIKYDALADKYHKMKRALVNFHEEFLCDID